MCIRDRSRRVHCCWGRLFLKLFFELLSDEHKSFSCFPVGAVSYTHLEGKWGVILCGERGYAWLDNKGDTIFGFGKLQEISADDDFNLV